MSAVSENGMALQFAAEALKADREIVMEAVSSHSLSSAKDPTVTKTSQRPHLVGTFLGFKMSKSRGREEKLRQNKAEIRKKKNLGNTKNPHKFVGVFLGRFLL